jgi:kinesin family protein 20
LSPLAKKSKAKAAQRASTVPKEIREVRKFVPDQPLPSDNEDAELTETEQGEDGESAVTTESEFDEGENDSEYGDEDDEEDWIPPPPVSSSAHNNKTPKAKAKAPQRMPSPAPYYSKASGNKTHLSKLQQEMEDLSIGGLNDSVVIIPVKKYKARVQSSNYGEDEDDDDDDIQFEVPAKKKKRYVKRV